VEFCCADSKMAPKMAPKRICVSSKPNMPKYTNLPQSLRWPRSMELRLLGCHNGAAPSAHRERARAVQGFPNGFPIVRVVLPRTPVETPASGVPRRTILRPVIPPSGKQRVSTRRILCRGANWRKVGALLRAARRTRRCVYCRARREEMQTEHRRTQRLRAQPRT